MAGCVLLNVSTIDCSSLSSSAPDDQPASVIVVALVLALAEATTAATSTSSASARTAETLRILPPPELEPVSADLGRRDYVVDDHFVKPPPLDIRRRGRQKVGSDGSGSRHERADRRRRRLRRRRRGDRL